MVGKITSQDGGFHYVIVNVSQDDPGLNFRAN